MGLGTNRGVHMADILYTIGKYRVERLSKHNVAIRNTKIKGTDNIEGYYSKLSHALGDLLEMLICDKKADVRTATLLNCINEAKEDVLNTLGGTDK